MTALDWIKLAIIAALIVGVLVWTWKRPRGQDEDHGE